MFVSKRLLIAGIAAVGLATGASQYSLAQSKDKDVVGEIGNNEGIFVDAKTFKVARGAAKGDPTAAIAKLGAKEVSPGAIIFRSGDKLYIAQGTPPTTSGSPQLMKDHQDHFAVSYMKQLQDFQDHWATSYMK